MATATSTGLTEGSHCSVCGEVIVAQTVIPMLENGGENQGGENQGGENQNGNEGNQGSNEQGNENQERNNEGSNENQGGNEQEGNEQGSENQGGNEQSGNEQGGENSGSNENNPTTAVAANAINAINIYARGNTLVVENANDEIRVYDPMGRLVCRDVACRVRTEITINTDGVYIVKTGNKTQRVVLP